MDVSRDPIRDETIDISELLVHHKSEDAHHRRPSVVDLDVALLQLGSLIEVVPAKINDSVAEVTGELGSSGEILHDAKLQHDHGEQGEWEDTAGLEREFVEVLEGLEAGTDLLKSRQAPAGSGGNVSPDGEH